MNVFFYGTLMDGDVRRLVLGPGAADLQIEDAVLQGYRRVGLQRRSYPVVLPDPKGTVQGCLAHDLDQSQFARLKEFESDEYVVRPCTVRVSGDREHAARVFAAGPLALPDLKPWSFGIWQERHKNAFLRRHSGA